MADKKKDAKKPEVLPEAEFSKAWEQEDQYEKVRQSKDPRFGDVTIFKQMWNNEVVFAKEKITNSKNDASNDITELKNRIALNHPHLQRLLNYSTSVKKELCSTNYISRGIYSFPHSDLQKEITDRKKNNQAFTHNELAHAGYQVLSGLQHLHARGVSHGDIRPLYIGYNKAANDFHILDRLGDPSPLEKLQGNNIINKKDLYLAPQLYKKLNGKDKTLKYSPTKNDLFALGLSLLHAGSLDSVQELYKPNGEFDNDKLEQRLVAFEQKYQPLNPPLAHVTRALLKPSEEDRQEAAAILAQLPPYEEYKRQESYGVFGGNQQTVYVQNAPAEVQQVSPQETHYVQPIETKVSYGQPIVRTYVYSQPPPDFDISKATSYYKEYKPSEDKLETAEGQLNLENKNITYVQAPVTTYVQSTPGNYSYQPGSYAPSTFEPIVRRSINREAKPQESPAPAPAPAEGHTETEVTQTKYSVNEKGEVVEEKSQ